MASTKHLLKNLASTVITVIVGEGENAKSIAVHRSLICDRSPFFAKCMNRRWKEYEDGIVRLPEDDPQVFDIYVQSLYLGHVSQFNGQDADGLDYGMLADLYAIAQKLQDVKAKNIASRTIYDKVYASMIQRKDKPDKNFVNLAQQLWGVTTATSLIRPLLINACLIFRVRTEADTDLVTKNFSVMDVEIVLNVAIELMKRKHSDNYSLGPCEKYLETMETEK